MGEHRLNVPIDSTDTRVVVVNGNGMLPLYHHGDRLVVSEEVPIRIGDRIIVQTTESDVLGGTLLHRDSNQICLSRGHFSTKSSIIDVQKVTMMARVLWASQ